MNRSDLQPAAHEKQNHQEHGEPDGLSRGKLKVFLGFAPGTGKTLAMLEDAYRRSLQGVDILIGYVNMHPDPLVMEALDKYKDLAFPAATRRFEKGLDLDFVLTRRPQLVLVDNIAQANPPGRRHESRFLEVEELLQAGIDVYTTLNVSQIESQADAVDFLTGLTVHSNVPDWLVDQADLIEMVDTPPQELVERYHAGLISFSVESTPLMEKFFKPANLFALRELGLRYVARRSADLMSVYLAKRGLADSSQTSERLLVCIGTDPAGGRLVRAGRRLADEARSDWTVVHVETPERPDVLAEEHLAQNLRLAQLLGAKMEILTGRTVAETVLSYAREHHIHKVIVGRSAPHRWYNLFGRSFSEQLLRLEPSLDVFVVGDDILPSRFEIARFRSRFSLPKLLSSLVLVVIPTLLGMVLNPIFISRSANLVMLYLLSVVIASIFLGPIMAAFTAVLSTIVFKYFFVPPLYQLFGFAPEHSITFLSLVLISIIISTLVSRERSLSRAASRRAEQVTQLYELSRDLATAVAIPDILEVIVQHISRTFGRESIILLAEKGQLVLSASSVERTLDRSERTAAEWAYQQGRPAGANTGTFSYASYSYIPMMTSHGTLGVIGIWFGDQRENLHPEQMRQLNVLVTKAVMAIERGLFAEQASQAEVLRVTEKLQSALLNSISHDLRTPLASITGVLSSLKMEDDFLDQDTRRELVETAFDEAERLNRLVGNLLDMTRLEAGNLRLSLQPCDIQDVIGSALNTCSSRLEGHPVNVNVQPDLPLVPMDYVLIAQVMVNLLDNAAKYSPERGPLDISARTCQDADGNECVEVEIADRGPGIPSEDLKRVFEKFYRVKRFQNVVGTGLGLAICKGMVEVHEGKIWADNRPEGGGRFMFSLPLRTDMEIKHERAVQAANQK